LGIAAKKAGVNPFEAMLAAGLTNAPQDEFRC